MSRLPPLPFTPVLLFWAWQGGPWILAGAAALWLEWALMTDRRWSLSEKDIERLVDLTSLALIALALYRFNEGSFADTLFTVLHWSPLVLLPLVSAQILSGRQGLERRALSYSLRRRTDAWARQPLNLVFPYLAACLLAAGQYPAHPEFYYPGLMILVAWGLWWYRPSGRRRILPLWLLSVAVAAGLGYLGQIGLRQLQSNLEDAAIAWLSERFSGDDDPYRGRTALGELGRLNLSDRILYRVETEAPLHRPMLLRTAVYDQYLGTSWYSRHRDFSEQRPLDQGDRWRWAESSDSGAEAVRIAAYLDEDRSLLALPTGSWGIDDLPVAGLSRNALGVVQSESGLGLVRYLARFDGAAGADAPPGERDLLVPNREQPALQELAERLQLAGSAPGQAMHRVREHFRSRFRYTLELPGKVEGRTALSHFLLDLQRGHCEYFATASVLLLRQAGIPARYAVGYSVQEPGYGTHQYLVRQSHAHAWALVWNDGRWWDLDSTPAIWYQVEEDRRPLWQPVLDLLSDLYYRFSRQRLEGDSWRQSPWPWGILLLLFLVLGYRLRPGKLFRRETPSRKPAMGMAAEAPLDRIAKVLHRAGFPRRPWETYGSWLRRLEKEPGLAQACGEAEPVLRLHYRLRYSTAGLSETEARQMEWLAERWLARWSRAVGQKVPG